VLTDSGGTEVELSIPASRAFVSHSRSGRGDGYQRG
jgi:hypothetical protein